MNSIEDFCHLYQQMRQAQNNYFASKKGHRFLTPESKKLLVISKQLEAELDSMVQNFLTQKQAGDILNEMEAQMFSEGTIEEKEVQNEMQFEYRYARRYSTERIIYIEYVDGQPHSVLTSDENDCLTTFDFNADCKESQMFMYFNSGGGGNINGLQAPHFVENANASYWMHPLASFKAGEKPINCQKLELPILYNGSGNVFENAREVYDEMYCKFCEKWYDEDSCTEHHLWDEEECCFVYFDGTDLEN